jgi:hypothetical protein
MRVRKCRKSDGLMMQTPNNGHVSAPCGHEYKRHTLFVICVAIITLGAGIFVGVMGVEARRLGSW